MAMEKKREKKKWTKKVQNKKDSKKSQENGLKKSKKKKKKRQNQKIAMASGKETYGEERKIKNNKGVFLPQNTTHLHLLIRLYELFLLRSRF